LGKSLEELVMRKAEDLAAGGSAKQLIERAGGGYCPSAWRPREVLDKIELTEEKNG
jgi:hypothetical protein